MVSVRLGQCEAQARDQSEGEKRSEKLPGSSFGSRCVLLTATCPFKWSLYRDHHSPCSIPHTFTSLVQQAPSTSSPWVPFHHPEFIAITLPHTYKGCLHLTLLNYSFGYVICFLPSSNLYKEQTFRPANVKMFSGI